MLHTTRRYLRSRVLPSLPVQLLLRTGLKWQQDDCSGMAAALSYHALFSLFPLLLVVLSGMASLIGPNTEAFQTMREALNRFLPPHVQDLVRDTVLALHQSRTGAGIIGFGLLLYSASTVFAVLNHSVARIWRSSQPASASLRQTVLSYLLNKLWAFLLVFSTGLLLLTSMLANLAIRGTLAIVARFRDQFPFLLSVIAVDDLQISKGLQVVYSLLVLTLAVAILFKILPSVLVAWRDVWLGSLLTAGLLVGLQQLVANSVISIGGHYLSYGVIGSVMILLLWLYLTCQIFFLGCEFTHAYAHLCGSRAPRRSRA